MPLRNDLPFWFSRTPGMEDAENRAALSLNLAWRRALTEGRYADARAITQEMSS